MYENSNKQWVTQKERAPTWNRHHFLDSLCNEMHLQTVVAYHVFNTSTKNHTCTENFYFVVQHVFKMTSILFQAFLQAQREFFENTSTNRPKNSSHILPHGLIEFGDVPGSHHMCPIFELAPKKEIWRAQVGLMGYPLKISLETEHAASRVFFPVTALSQ